MSSALARRARVWRAIWDVVVTAEAVVDAATDEARSEAMVRLRASFAWLRHLRQGARVTTFEEETPTQTKPR